MWFFSFLTSTRKKKTTKKQTPQHFCVRTVLLLKRTSTYQCEPVYVCPHTRVRVRVHLCVHSPPSGHPSLALSLPRDHVPPEAVLGRVQHLGPLETGGGPRVQADGGTGRDQGCQAACGDARLPEGPRGPRRFLHLLDPGCPPSPGDVGAARPWPAGPLGAVCLSVLSSHGPGSCNLGSVSPMPSGSQTVLLRASRPRALSAYAACCPPAPGEGRQVRPSAGPHHSGPWKPCSGKDAGETRLKRHRRADPRLSGAVARPSGDAAGHVLRVLAGGESPCRSWGMITSSLVSHHSLFKPQACLLIRRGSL